MTNFSTVAPDMLAVGKVAASIRTKSDYKIRLLAREYPTLGQLTDLFQRMTGAVSPRLLVGQCRIPNATTMDYCEEAGGAMEVGGEIVRPKRKLPPKLVGETAKRRGKEKGDET